MTRKLDALVAEKVMNWQYRQDAPENYSCPEFGGNAGWWQEPDGDWLCANCMEEIFPSYSTNIAAAWQVVEKLREQSIAMTISTMGPRSETMVYTTVAGVNSSTVWEESAPLAICVAALKAVGSDAALNEKAPD